MSSFTRRDFPHPCLAEDRDHPAGGAGRRSVERCPEDIQLVIPTNERGVQAPEESRSAQRDLDETEGGDPLRLALEVERLDRLDSNGMADEPVGLLSDQDLVWPGRLLQPRGDVDRVARDHRLAGREVAGHHLPGVDPGSDLEPRPPILLELFV
jgi:hypothetical protein